MHERVNTSVLGFSKYDRSLFPVPSFANNYMFKVNNKDTRTTLMDDNDDNVFIVNFTLYISHSIPAFSLLTLSR